jgi:hypothetical protein
MELEAIVRDNDAEISRLEKVRALLTGHTAPLKRGMPPTEVTYRPQDCYGPSRTYGPAAPNGHAHREGVQGQG